MSERWIIKREIRKNKRRKYEILWHFQILGVVCPYVYIDNKDRVRGYDTKNKLAKISFDSVKTAKKFIKKQKWKLVSKKEWKQRYQNFIARGHHAKSDNTTAN